jgi:hypothetical protein
MGHVLVLGAGNGGFAVAADLSRRGLERARLFTWPASAEKVLSIYRRFAR